MNSPKSLHPFSTPSTNQIDELEVEEIKIAIDSIQKSMLLLTAFQVISVLLIALMAYFLFLPNGLTR